MKTATLTTLALLAASPFAFARGGSSTVGPGNPAAIFCLNEGGTLERTRTKLGQDALCRFGEKAAIPQWTLFRARNGGGEKAVEAFLNPREAKVGGLGNPASLYCAAQGGETQVETLSDETPVGICRFPDSSGIEEWTLFRGASDAANAELLKALR